MWLIDGALEVICKDDYSMAWLGIAVENLGPLAGTIFKAVDAGQLVKRKKVMVWVPGPIKFDTRILFKRLEKANLQQSRTATGVLEEILSKVKIKVALIQESWCYNGRIRRINLRGGQIICTSADTPRTCKYINGVDAMSLPQFSSMDLAAAVLSFQKRNMIRRIVICSSYLPYDAPDPPPNRDLEDLVTFCKTKSWDLLVGCDSS
ncbi:hypothetical protein J437_LFUL011041 [Ladona fulva]|uniref:DUF4780 domain-containing protein n=1 Tax=Ladona fulva TaxID=123851 RepID=A0A8K0KEE2_LADFU|nr:hypothetical protein J437_LFUL011041 [Ladona fulva]